MDERRASGYYKEDQRDFVDVFLLEIDKHSKDTSDANVFTGIIKVSYVDKLDCLSINDISDNM